MAEIVLVDDDTAMRGFLDAALTRAGHHVVSFADGAGAYQHLAMLAQPVDLLLTDIVMPGMDGLELARRALILRPGLPIMYITGFGAVSRTGGSSTPEAGPVLAKPIHLGQLVAEVERVLGARVDMGAGP